MRVHHKDQAVKDSEESGRFPRFYPFLDGKFLPKCVMADEEAGVVTVYRLDANGNYIKNAAMDDVERQDLQGSVEILDIEKICSWSDADVRAVSRLELGTWAREVIDAEFNGRGLK